LLARYFDGTSAQVSRASGLLGAIVGLRPQLGPANDAIERLEGRVRENAERHAHKVSLVGVTSGTLAREAAKRWPGLRRAGGYARQSSTCPWRLRSHPSQGLCPVLWDKNAQDAIGRIRPGAAGAGLPRS